MTDLTKIDLSVLKGEPEYRGSVQDLYSLTEKGKDYFLCRTSESGSVFDVGTIFSVPESDVMRTAVRHHIYTSMADPETWKAIGEDDVKRLYSNPEIVSDLLDNPLLSELRTKGASTHHKGMVDSETGEVIARGFPKKPSSMVLIEKFPVYKPGRFSMWGRYAWDYHEYFGADKKVISLEHVFRLGSPGGSSLFSRYDAAKKDGDEAVSKFLASVGLSRPPEPWAMFPDMVYDCTTKYEPSDRSLSWQETVHLSGLPGDKFKDVVRTLVYCTMYVSKFFRERGFTLWDLKWECAVDGDRIVVVDTIDPDSIRVTGQIEYKGKKLFMHFNKQAIRDYYKLCHKGWYDSINQAKKLSKTDSQGRDFMEIYRDKVEKGEFPDIPEQDPEFSKIQSRKYAVMVEPLMGKTTREEANKEAQDLMKRELEYFEKAGKLEKIIEMNAAS